MCVTVKQDSSFTNFSSVSGNDSVGKENTVRLKWDLRQKLKAASSH